MMRCGCSDRWRRNRRMPSSIRHSPRPEGPNLPLPGRVPSGPPRGSSPRLSSPCCTARRACKIFNCTSRSARGAAGNPKFDGVHRSHEVVGGPGGLVHEYGAGAVISASPGTACGCQGPCVAGAACGPWAAPNGAAPCVAADGPKNARATPNGTAPGQGRAGAAPAGGPSPRRFRDEATALGGGSHGPDSGRPWAPTAL